MNWSKQENTVSAEGPTLPVMYMKYGDVLINMMQGYTTDLDDRSIRDSLTPLSDDGSVSFQITTYSNKITSVRYEITDLVNDKVVENGKITDLTEGDGTSSGSFTPGCSLLSDQEYGLCFQIRRSGASTLYYYTRIIRTQNTGVAGYLDFAQDFYQNCISKADTAAVADSLESDSTAMNNSFRHLDIHASTDMVTWGSLSPTLVRKAVPTIRELSDYTGVISVRYVISSQDSDGNTEYYTVEDDYRVNQGTDKVNLLNFERYTTETFNPSNPVAQEDGLCVGVTGRDLPYKANSDGDIVAFVTGGELWEYNRSRKTAVKVFSFREESQIDLRTENPDHAISIQDMTDSGDITFIVYGYMSSGAHEGGNGIGVYQYSASDNSVEEKCFISLNQGFDRLQSSVSKLAYLTDDGSFYIFAGSEFIRVSGDGSSYEVLKNNLSADSFFASSSQSIVAWSEGTATEPASTVTLKNLDSGEEQEIRAPEGEMIIPLGFMNEDFIYGLVREDDIVTDSVGEVTTGMHEVCIVNESGEVLKQYEKEGCYITDINAGSDSLELVLSKKTDSGYESAGTDHIMDNTDSGQSVSIDVMSTKRKAQQVVITFNTVGSTDSLTTETAGYIADDGLSETQIQWPEDTSNVYYVYDVTGLVEVDEKANTAIETADSAGGTVLNSLQQYVYQRGAWPTSKKINSGDVPEGLLTSGLNIDELQQALGDNYIVTDLTGCSAESLYYPLSHGSGVLAKIDADGSTVVVLGYDQYNFWVYDPSAEDGALKAMGKNDTTELFNSAGNVFLSYTLKSSAGSETSSQENKEAVNSSS